MATAPATAAVDLEFAQEFIQRWADAWNSHQPDRVLALMATDIVYDDTAWPRTMHGHADVRDFLEHMWRAFPDLHFDAVGGPYLHPSEPQVAWMWRGAGTQTGPIDPPGVPATRRRMEIEGFDLHTYRDGIVSRLWIGFDMATAMRQLGALPERGSRAERAMARLARLRARLGAR